MEINPEQILRSGKHAGKTLDWVRRFDKRYFDWMQGNRPEMMRSHKDYQKKPSGWAPGYEKTKSPFRDEEYVPQKSYPQQKSYGGGSPYKRSNAEIIQDNYERWSNPDSWTNRVFDEPPDGPSRYSLLNSPPWSETSEGDSED